MALNFTAIDFETANGFRRSACSIGMTKIRDGQIVDRFASLIRPPDDAAEFTNTRVHGITADDVRNAPRWPDLLPSVERFIGPDYLVAHNAAFDSSVLARSSEAYGLRVEGLRFVCTLNASRAMLSLGSYSLPFVTRELGIDVFQHHDASADSDAAALVAVALASLASVSDIAHFSSIVSSRSVYGGQAQSAPVGAADWMAVAAAGSLAGETVCFTGTLRTMNREVAKDLVRRLGGAVSASTTKKTTMLVAGDCDERTLRPGAHVSRKLARAFDLAAAGQRIRIMTEDEFLRNVGITEDEAQKVKRRMN